MTSKSAEPCFFVLGYGRSGTTLLRRMLSAHPALYVPPENDAFQRLPPLMGRTVRSTDALMRLVKAFPPYYDRIYDADQFVADASRRLPLSRPEFFATLLQSSRIAESKVHARWGHKSPSEYPYVKTWRAWFPQAQYLHIVRHPHDATASMVQYQLQRYPTTPLVAIWQWRSAFRTIRRHGAVVGPQGYLMLKYEDLVGDPAEVLTGICGFLDVSTSAVDTMIDYRSDPSAAHVDEGVHMARTDGSITAERVGRAAGAYTARQTAMFDHICRREMRELDYDPRGSERPGPARRLLYDLACRILDVAWCLLRMSRRVRRQL